MPAEIYYSDKYYDEEHEYRHVVLPKEMVKLVPKNQLMTEQEWRGIGVQQSQGWVHYMTHQPAAALLTLEATLIGNYYLLRNTNYEKSKRRVANQKTPKDNVAPPKPRARAGAAHFMFK